MVQTIIFQQHINHLMLLPVLRGLKTGKLNTGFVLFSGLKIQGLFKDIPGRNSNFSSTPSSTEKMPLECDTR